MKPVNPDNYDQEDITMAFDFYVVKAQEVIDKYMETRFPRLPKYTVEVKPGSIYWKLVKTSENQECVYGFVRKSDGAIFKAASYKAPYTKGASAIRGYVTDEWAVSTLTPHGVTYAI